MKLEDFGFRRVSGPRGLTFFATKPSIHVDIAMINALEREVAEHNCNARLCLHNSPNSEFHDMVIAERKGGIPPHRHPWKDETLHVIHGRLNVRLFDNDGRQTEETGLLPSMVYRIGKNVFHEVTVASDFAIYHESKPGPFLGEADREFLKE